MKILVVASLFPPDISTPARYAKELAEHLSQQDTTLIAYGKIPETVPGVKIKSVSKRGNKLSLVWYSLKNLIKVDKDLLVINNGPSVELPVLLYSIFSPQTKIVLIMSDQRLINDNQGLYKLVHRLMKKRTQANVELPSNSDLFIPPEKLPFSEVDQSVLKEQEKWWSEHVKNILSYAK